MKNVVEIRNLSKTFKNGEHEIYAVNNLNLDIKEGDLVVVVGPSGAGKSTLLNLIGGMENATSGKILVDGEDITKYSSKQMADYRKNKIGFVFQFYNLMANLTALENVELSSEMVKDSMKPEDALIQMGLRERMNNFPAQLSGGEQQRVSIARAIAKKPRILLCDEPTGALDYTTGKSILRILQKLALKEHKTVIIVTHNSALTAMGNVTIEFKNGAIRKITKNKTMTNIGDIVW